MSELQRKQKLKNLLNGTIESYYWAGFILADGHITPKGRLTITLSDKDESLLHSLNDFLGCIGLVRVRSGKANFSVNDVETMLKFRKRFGVNNQKTYNPPESFDLQGAERDAFFIGFVDGDGHIAKQTGRNDCKLSIKLHSRWLEYLTQMMGKQCRINSQGYAYGCIADNSELKRLHLFAKDNNLPILDRKWSLIDLEYVSRTEIHNHLKPLIFDMYNHGCTIVDISEFLGLKYTRVRNCLERNGKLCKT